MNQNNENQKPQKGSILPHYKQGWDIEDASFIKWLEDEFNNLVDRRQRHCFNPKMYKFLSGIIDIFIEDIKKEKELYEREYSKAYHRASGIA